MKSNPRPTPSDPKDFQRFVSLLFWKLHHATLDAKASTGLRTVTKLRIKDTTSD
jgi:hypothetical protein